MIECEACLIEYEACIADQGGNLAVATMMKNSIQVIHLDDESARKLLAFLKERTRNDP